MPAYIALLRAVNVGGTGKLPMTELRAMCEARGFANVRAYIASGNVVFTAEPEAAVKTALEKALEAYAGKPVGVMMRTGAEMAAVCAAKVAGLAMMADVWPLRAQCRILACSSVFGVWGGHGHAAYAASNRLLDVLAAQLRVEGLDCTAIRWGLWQDAGVVEAGEINRTQRSGLIAMEANAALDASLGRYAEDPLIFAADFDRLRVFFQSQGTPTPFTAVLNGDTAAGGNHSSAKPLADVVRSELAATLHLGDSLSVDPSASLVDLGLDSLLALDLRRRLRRAVGHSAPVAQMLGGITVSELIDVLGLGAASGSAVARTPERLDSTRD